MTDNREKIIIKTSIIGIIGNILLVVAKAIIGFIANSVAIITDALNNLTDTISSIVTIVGTKLSNKKPDKKHPFGHGRVEYITSMVISGIILFAGFMAIYESVQALINNEKSTYNIASIIVVSIAIVVKIVLGLYFRKMGKKVNSDSLKGMGTDALFDALLSASTLVGVIVSLTAGVSIEGWLGIVIGLFILRSGIELMRTSLSSLIGQRIEKEEAVAIKSVVCSFPEVYGAYDLIINNYGPNTNIGSIHIEVDDNLPASEIHLLSRKIQEAIYTQFHVILTVGIYSHNDSNEKFKNLKQIVKDEISTYPEITQIHGFYIDDNRKLISFDLIFDFSCEKVNEIIEQIKKNLNVKIPDYLVNIIIDKDISD